MKGFPRRGSNNNKPVGILHIDEASMKGFPRRGSNSRARRLRACRRRLNEGLPQKGKQCGSPTSSRKSPSGLNEGLPQKGKQFEAEPARPGLPPIASMKGFPRRGSNSHRGP